MPGNLMSFAKKLVSVGLIIAVLFFAVRQWAPDNVKAFFRV